MISISGTITIIDKNNKQREITIVPVYGKLMLSDL